MSCWRGHTIGILFADQEADLARARSDAFDLHLGRRPDCCTAPPDYRRPDQLLEAIID